VTWPIVALVIGVLAIAAARDILVRSQKALAQTETDERVEAIEKRLAQITADISNIDASVRDQNTRLTLSRRRSG